MGKSIEEFNAFREKMNQHIFDSGNLEIKRFFALDKHAYKKGALPDKTKELLGLVASMVLRCNDCVNYHLLRCAELEVSNAQLFEAFNVALVVGGSIVIPHLRNAVAFLEGIRSQEEDQARG